MAQTAFRGTPVETSGNLPEVGQMAPDFQLTKMDLSDATLKDFAGKKLILNIFPSVDTAVCATSVRQFHVKAEALSNVLVLNISADLPFAHKRFCAAEGIENTVSLSDMRARSFGEAYGVRLLGSPLAGLFARSVVVLNEEGQVTYTELVADITQEPNYEAALAVLK